MTDKERKPNVIRRFGPEQIGQAVLEAHFDKIIAEQREEVEQIQQEQQPGEAQIEDGQA